MYKRNFKMECGYHGNKTIRVEGFDSTDEFIRIVSSREVPDALSDKAYFKKDDGSLVDSWCGCSTVGEFKRNIDFGITDAKRIKAVQAFIKKANDGEGPVDVRANRVVGGSVNVGRYMTGIPTCMRGRMKEERPDKTIHIVVDVGVLSDISSRQLVECSTYVAAAIDKIQRLGYNVKITVCTATMMHSNNSILIAEILLKPYGSRLSLPRLLFWCGHPSAFRMGFFNQRASRDDFPRGDWGGFGASMGARMSEADRNAVYNRVFGRCVPICFADLLRRGYRTDEDWLKGLQATLLDYD